MVPRAEYTDGATTATLTSESLSSNTWIYQQLAIGACGAISDYSIPLSITVTGTTMDPAIGNDPIGLRATAIKGAKIKTEWHYSTKSEESEPDGFNVYYATTRGGSETLGGTVAYRKRNRQYTLTTHALTDGTLYWFRVLPYKTSGEKITNGNMEAGGTATTLPTGWVAVTSPTTQGMSTVIKYENSQSLFISASTGIRGAEQTALSFTSGNVYDVSAWVYTPDTTKVRFIIRKADDGTGTGTPETTNNSTIVQSVWNFISFQFTATASGSLGQIELLTDESATGTLYFDNVSLRDTVQLKQNYDYTTATADSTGPTAITPISVKVL